MKLCTNCIYYEKNINYCNNFKFKTNSISSASICCKFTQIKIDEPSYKSSFTQADSLIKSSNKSKNSKKETTTLNKCRTCSSLFFNSFCNSLNKNILNTNKPIRCEFYKKK